MPMRTSCWALAPVVYFAAGLTTFAYVYDSWGPVQKYDTADKAMGSGLSGVFWPIYWSGTAALSAVHALRERTQAPLACIDADGNTWAPEGGFCKFRRKEGHMGSEGEGHIIVPQWGGSGIMPGQNCRMVNDNTFSCN